jgi:hypothetical protein
VEGVVSPYARFGPVCDEESPLVRWEYGEGVTQPTASTLKGVKRDGLRPPIIAAVAALFCVVMAIGAGLEGRFSFAGPIWSPPDGSNQPVKLTTSTPTPPPPSASPLPVPNHLGITFSWVPIAIVMAILVVAVLAVLVLLWIRKHPRRGTPRQFSTVDTDAEDLLVGQEAVPDLPTLSRGLALASEALNTERTPRDAIVRAWVGLQEAAEDSGVSRRPSETPTEFTARVFTAVDADRSAADTLLALYLRVRFGTHPAGAKDLRTAKDAIKALRASWPDGGSK